MEFCLFRIRTNSDEASYFGFYIQLRFRKAGRVWCGGAREAH